VPRTRLKGGVSEWADSLEDALFPSRLPCLSLFIKTVGCVGPHLFFFFFLKEEKS
jgi:hypothetical protein